MSSHPDIYILGTGIRGADDVTRETLDALQASNEVLYVDPAIGSAALLRQHCSRVTSLYEESYTEDAARLGGYRHMAVRVVEAALSHPPVSFAMHGHPMVLCEAPFLIHRMAVALDLNVSVLPGISALDHLFADLLLDPGRGGMLMYEATDMLLRHRPLLPEVPTLLWQVGNLETRLHSPKASRPERFNRLLNYLETAYPKEHLVYAYYASPHAMVSPAVSSFTLKDLPAHAEHIHAGTTLYLPPSRPQAIVDEELLRDMDDPEHLARITK